MEKNEAAIRLADGQVEAVGKRAAAFRAGLMKMKCECSDDCKVVECDLEGLVDLFNQTVNAVDTLKGDKK